MTAAEAKPANKQADKRYKLTLAKNTIKMDVKAQEKATITAKLSSPKKPLKQEDLEKAIIEAGSTNERVVRIGEYDGVWAKNLTGTQLTSDIPIIAVEPGTAYVYVKTKLEDSSSYNIRVCKVTVTAKASEVEITGDSANKMTGYTEDELKKMNISVKSTDPVDKNNIGLIELKQGECDRLFTSLTPANTTDIVNMKWTVSGGVTIKNGVVYAKKASAVKKGITTPAKVTLTCGKKKYMIYIVVK